MPPKLKKRKVKKPLPQEELFEVEVMLKARLVRIADKHITRSPKKKPDNSDWEYLVKWVGYTSDENSWEPESNLAECSTMLLEFWEDIKLQYPAGFNASVGQCITPSKAWIEKQINLSRDSESEDTSSDGGTSDTSDDIPLTRYYNKKPSITIKLPSSASKRRKTENLQEPENHDENHDPTPTEITTLEATFDAEPQMAQNQSRLTPDPDPLSFPQPIQTDDIVMNTVNISAIHLKLKGMNIPARVIRFKRVGESVVQVQDVTLPETLVVENAYYVADVQALLASYIISEHSPAYLLLPEDAEDHSFGISVQYFINRRQATLIPIHDPLKPQMTIGHYFLIPFDNIFEKVISEIAHSSLVDFEVLNSAADKIPRYFLFPLLLSVGRLETLETSNMAPVSVRGRGSTAKLLKNNPWFSLGSKILQIPPDIMKWLASDPAQRPFLLWNDFDLVGVGGSKSPSASLEARLESKMLSTVLTTLGMRPARADHRARVLFIHAESLRRPEILSRLCPLKKSFEPAVLTIYRYGSSCGIIRGVEEIYPCGGIVTFTPKALIEGHCHAIRLMAKLHEHPLWSCYMIPLTLGVLLDMYEHMQTGSERMARVLNQVMKRITAGHLSLITSAPISSSSRGEAPLYSRSTWLRNYLSAVPPTPARVRALSMSEVENARVSLEQDYDYVLEEISKDIILMQQQAAIMRQYRRYVVVMGDMEAKEIGDKWKLKDGAEWVPLSQFDFGDAFFQHA